MQVQTENMSRHMSYQDLLTRMENLSSVYGNLSDAAMSTAIGQMYQKMGSFSPQIQNNRVKAISSLPRDFGKNEVVEMITNPYGNEQPIRQVAHALEFTAYPYYKIRKTYQDLLTYHHYAFPAYVEEEDAKKPEFNREWRLVDKFIKECKLKQFAHKVTGQAVQEGKVFYTPRYGVDKSHNKARAVLFQQLPSDYCKIVGYNSVSGYTVAFNMFYLMQPGVAREFFGDLLTPYVNDFASLFCEEKTGKTVFAGRPVQKADGTNLYVNMDRWKAISEEAVGSPEMTTQNGKWFYWVVLPPEKVWTFEVDDCNPAVVTPLTGLFLSMVQIAQYESLQYELLVNPLVSIITGEIPYFEATVSSREDGYKLSPTGRTLFEALFYEMMRQNNTSGIGFFTAPVENMKMHQLSEAPNAEKISASGYSYAVMKSGLSGIIPVTSEPRAGLAQVSMQLESRFAETIYLQIERMMECLLGSMNLKWDWRFHMFGSLATDEQDKRAAKEGMTLGILTDTLRYAALHDFSLLDDLSISNAVIGLGLLDKRLPLVSSYSAKNENGLPPQLDNEGGRPKSEGVTSDGQEQDLDE